MAGSPRGKGKAAMPPKDQSLIDAYWKQFQAAWAGPGQAPEQYYEAFQFGSTPETIDELARLVLAGTKTATSALRWEFEQSNASRPPQVGDFSIVLDTSGMPVCVIETIEVWEAPFAEAATEQFAYEYGEGDRTVEWWRRELWEYYERVSAAHGWTLTEQSPLVCERFRLAHPS